MEGHLLVGQVGKPHGVTGEVYVVVISDDPSRFLAGSTLIREDGSPLEVAATRSHNDRLLITFAGVEGRDAADRIRGPLYAPANSPRKELESDEYWSEDLIGCSVVDRTGAPLGTATDVISNAAQELLIIDGKHMVPMVKEIVVSVDVAAGTIVIDPPEGLLD